jgi:hypothetical protein
MYLNVSVIASWLSLSTVEVVSATNFITDVASTPITRAFALGLDENALVVVSGTFLTAATRGQSYNYAINCSYRDASLNTYSTSTSGSVSVVQGTNLAPTLSFPSLSVQEGSSLRLSELQLSDNDFYTEFDDGILSLNISTANGTLALDAADATELGVRWLRRSSSSLQFRCSLNCSADALGRVVFHPSSYGNATVTLVATDNGASGAGGSKALVQDVPITVLMTAEIPSLGGPVRLAIFEDQPVALSQWPIVNMDAYAPSVLTLGQFSVLYRVHYLHTGICVFNEPI